MSNRYPKKVRRYIKQTGALAHKKLDPEQTADCFTQKNGRPLTDQQIAENDFRMAVYPGTTESLEFKPLLNGEPVEIA